MPAPSRRTPSANRAGFLPAPLKTAVTRSMFRAGGFVLAVLALALFLALCSYDSADPSWNIAAEPGRAIVNRLGAVGAIAADLGIQLFGLLAFLPVLAILVWGLRLLITAQPPERIWVRFAFLLSAMLLGAIACAALPLPSGARPALLVAGAGGSAGRLLLGGIGTLTSAIGLPVWIPALISGLMGLSCAVLALGLSWTEWRETARSGAAAIRGISQSWTNLIELPTRLFARSAPPDLPAKNNPPPRGEPVLRRERVVEDDDPADEPVPVKRAAEPLVAPRPPRAQPGKRIEESRQHSLDLPDTDGYKFPPLDLLAAPAAPRGDAINQDALAQNARLLEAVLEDFGVQGEIVKVRPGPVVTLYELEPSPGTKTSRVIGLADDIARSMSALSVRIATVPGRSVIGIELPNAKREIVLLRELLASEAFERAASRLTLVLGKDIGGQPVMVDLARMPHLLIAGTTGSGKSVAINTMILSLLYRLKPEECRLIMIDPKMLELSVYDGIPHLLAPVVTEPGKAVVALKWAVREMEDRYRAMSQLGVRNISGYNQRLAEASAKNETLSRTVQTGFDPETGKPVYEDQTLALEPLPFIVVVVDEMADLMLVAGKDVEAAVQRLAQMARAAGIHIVMATQRPSVDVITGTIKANFPSRISFQVTSKIDSRTILGEQGAEQLLGQGDMLYMAAGGRIIRVHGPFVSDGEVEAVVQHLREQGEPHYLESVTEEEEVSPDASASGGGGGDLYDQAVALVIREGKASTSFVQRHLQIGYNRAARIIEQMEAEGVVSKANHVGKREVLARGGRDD
ncbi:MAG: DNA translocase FtsK 4TM domain-containing protein [Rhodospirillaceae bacterium]|nr:DNA translocase FtsK 4TM domain-containing protein [Rhodospirillaceae bacterium]